MKGLQPKHDRSLQVRVLETPPAEWDSFLQRVPDAELAAGSLWTELAARHYQNSWPCWMVGETKQDGLIAGLPLLGQCRRGLVYLQSSFDGTVAGPQVAADLPPDIQDRAFSALCLRLAELVGGRTVLATVTVATAEARRRLTGLLPRCHSKIQLFQSAVVDCRQGLARIEAEAWTKNRRNERNRGLKRGCTLHCEQDPSALEQWYPIYLQQARQWAQAPVPLGFLQDLMRQEPTRVLLNSVRLQGKVVGAHFCLISRNRLVAYLSGVDRFIQRTHFLNTLLYWQTIRHACENGLEAVDFGGSVGRDSLWDFKRRCGAVPEERAQLQILSKAGRFLQMVSSVRRSLRGAHQ